MIPTKTVVQGITAAMNYNTIDSVEAIEAAMTGSIAEVVSGAVTYAVRDTSFNGTKIEKDDIIGMLDNEIVVVEKNVEDASAELLKKMIAKRTDDAVITLYSGEGVSEDNANALVERLAPDYPDAEFIVQPGGQPLYYYYFSVE